MLREDAQPGAHTDCLDRAESRGLCGREGQFSVLARDPAVRAGGLAVFSPPAYEGPTNNAGAYTPPAPASLEEAKALLERCLLPCEE